MYLILKVKLSHKITSLNDYLMLSFHSNEKLNIGVIKQQNLKLLLRMVISDIFNITQIIDYIYRPMSSFFKFNFKDITCVFPTACRNAWFPSIVKSAGQDICNPFFIQHNRDYLQSDTPRFQGIKSS